MMKSNRAKAALAAGLGLVALTATYLTAPWEGKENTAYWDRIGRVWTVCYGETKGVRKGMTLTDEECSAKLYARLENDFHKPLTRCIPAFDAAPLSWQAAMLDLSYNVGVGAACGSTAAKRARAQDFKGSCEAMTWWNKGGNPKRTIRGLKLRREYGDAYRIGAQELCEAGLDD